MKKLNFLLISLLFAGYTQTLNATSQIQTPHSIQQAVREFIASNLPLDTEYKLKISQIDSRLKLSLCSVPLHVFTPNITLKAGRNSIGVTCNNKKKWTIYNSTNISIYKDVLILSQPIRRGEIFNKHMLHLEKRNISSLRSGFYTDPHLIIAKQATRNLSLGSVINQTNITEAKLIKRGEKVTIRVNSPYLEISAPGIAMMDGINNQNIRVKNLNSHQIIQATVVKPGQVVVIF
ncbi:MAG: flagellar basal body P-ring formation chaperone FlgA [Methylococcaceae bacterium]